jgi:predicted Zn-dependent protease
VSAQTQGTAVAAPQETAERAVELCGGAESCVAIVTQHSEANLRWANSSLTTDGTATSVTVTVVVTVGTRRGIGVGVVSRRGDVHDELPELVAAAREAARRAEPAEDGRALVSGTRAAPDWWEPIPETSMAALSSVAPALGEAFGHARANDWRLYGYAEHRVSSTFLASSSGLRLRTDSAARQLELTGRTADGTRSTWAGVADDLGAAAVAGLYAQVDQRLTWARRQLDLAPGRYETVLPPAAVADLMNYVYFAAVARETIEGRTVYSGPNGGTRVGERLTGLPLTLRGDPTAPGLGCAPFVIAPSSDELVSVFDNGLALHPTAWIDEGVLAALLQTRHTAALTGMPLTPHIDNLILEGTGASASLDELVAGTGRGLLLTTLWYIREVDPATLLLTGLTRDGVYLVEQGEVVGAVNNFRFNESPVDLLRRVVDVGVTGPVRAREWGDAFTHCAMPAMRVADFHMSSVSRAV